MEDLKKFKPQSRISTTLREDLQKLAFDKVIPWSEAIERGVKEIAFGDIPMDTNQTEIRVTKKNIIARLKQQHFQMEKLIKELEDETG